MAISLKKYINITSGVGGATQVSERELILRLMTTNNLVPTGDALEFTSASDVGVYFGTLSEEYKRAVFYFGWVSKAITSPRKLSFGRWADADTAPQIFGGSKEFALADFTAVTDGAFSLTFGAITETITGLDFSGAADLAAVATIVQVAVRASNVDANFAAAVVSYDAVAKRFNVTGGATGAAIVEVGDGLTGTELRPVIGWDNPVLPGGAVDASNTILSDGVVAETVQATMIAQDDLSDNFGSFVFMPALTDQEVIDVATWNKTENVKYQFFVSILEADAADHYAALKDIGGVGVIIKHPTAVEYPEMAPSMVLAATDYTRPNANKNYMYQQFNLTPSVTSTSKSNVLDAARANYYGQTQSAGSKLEFFQRGLLMGLATDPKDMNVYANEQWFKSNITARLLNLLLILDAVPANLDGEGLIDAGALTGAISLALLNGTILPNKTLTDAQKVYITQITGDNEAWRQVASLGYWKSVVIRENEQEAGEYEAVYMIIYAKGDAVRTVDGTHILV